MSRSRRALVGVACAMAAASFVACTRSSGSAEPPSSGSARSSVDDDVKGVAKATEKTAKDVGHATADLAEKAGKGLEDVTSKAGVSGQDAWITTKVKSELAGDGFDPLHVHVDTDAKVVTLSGTVESGTKAQRAVAVAKAVNGVVSVKNHLFVKPAKH
jgi:hyperosmotically inducible protein